MKTKEGFNLKISLSVWKIPNKLDYGKCGKQILFMPDAKWVKLLSKVNRMTDNVEYRKKP